MSNLLRRLARLEGVGRDSSRLAPQGEEAFAYWVDVIDQLMEGQDPRTRRRIPLEVVGRIIERAVEER